MTNLKRSNRRTIIIIAAALLIVAIASGFYFLSASQYFSVDVNPSIEIETNRLDKVVSLNPLNADAQTLVAGYRGTGKNLGEVIEDLVDRMILQGYLGSGEPNDILITVKDDSVSQKTLDKVNESIERQLDNRNIKANLHSQKVDWSEETEKSAQLAGVSPGKMNMVEEIAKEAEVSPQDLSELKIGELINYNKEDSEKISDDNENELDENDSDGWDFLEDNGAVEADQTDVVDSTTTSGKPVDEAGAKAVFDSYYPGISVQQIKLQDGGKVYYMYSNVDGVGYKMKVRVSDGEVLYNYSGAQGGNNSNNNNSENSRSETSTPQSSVASVGGSIDEAGAKAIFASHYPGVSIEKIELQDGGKVYYMYSYSDGVSYKMKVRVSDGEVVYNYSSGSGGNYNNNNSNNSQNSQAESTTSQSSIASTGGAVDEAGAKAIFDSYYPGVSVEKIELQDGGKVYYMYSNISGTSYKMKVRVSDGEVVYNYSGSNGGGNYGGNNNNRGGNRGNYGGNYGG